jgi:hypothetical protein
MEVILIGCPSLSTSLQELRRLLAQKQAADGVEDYKALPDPPLMKLENEASHSYLSVLLHINMAPGGSDVKAAACIEERLVELCTANLERYEVRPLARIPLSRFTAGSELSIRRWPIKPLIVFLFPAKLSLNFDYFIISTHVLQLSVVFCFLKYAAI